DPGPVALGKIRQHVLMHNLLQIRMLRSEPVARMADAKPDATVIAAEMRPDRPKAIMAGVAAADFDPQLGGRQLDLVMKHGDRVQTQLEEARRFLNRGAGIGPERGGGKR